MREPQKAMLGPQNPADHQGLSWLTWADRVPLLQNLQVSWTPVTGAGVSVLPESWRLCQGQLRTQRDPALPSDSAPNVLFQPGLRGPRQGPPCVPQQPEGLRGVFGAEVAVLGPQRG